MTQPLEHGELKDLFDEHVHLVDREVHTDNGATREAVEMPSQSDLRKALHTLDLAICAAEDDKKALQVTNSQIEAMRDAYEVLDWFVR